MKIDKINREILSITHTRANISNQELADLVGLSNSACLQRVKALKDAGLFKSFSTDLDLDRMVEHVLAYVEFTLENNNLKHRRAFEEAIESIPEFMDCLRITGETDYISLTCCGNTQNLSKICDDLSSNEALGIQKIRTRIILERSKWYLGYPLKNLKWLSNFE